MFSLYFKLCIKLRQNHHSTLLIFKSIMRTIILGMYLHHASITVKLVSFDNTHSFMCSLQRQLSNVTCQQCSIWPDVKVFLGMKKWCVSKQNHNWCERVTNWTPIAFKIINIHLHFENYSHCVVTQNTSFIDSQMYTGLKMLWKASLYFGFLL